MKNLFFFICLPLVAPQLWMDAMPVEALLFLGKWGKKKLSGMLFCDTDGNWTFQYSQEVNSSTTQLDKKGNKVEAWGRRTRNFTIPIHQFGIANYDAVKAGLENGTFKGNPLLALETDKLHNALIPLVKAVFPGQGQINYNENATGGTLSVNNSVVLRYTKSNVNGVEKIEVTYCDKKAVITAIEQGDTDLSYYTECVDARYQKWLESTIVTKDKNMKKETKVAIVYDDMFDDEPTPPVAPVVPPVVPPAKSGK